jgi:hypothetical protein
MTFIEKAKKEFFKKFIGERWNEMELPFMIAKINGFWEEKICESVLEYDKELKFVASENSKIILNVLANERNQALAEVGIIEKDDISDNIGTTHKDAEGVVIEEEEE